MPLVNKVASALATAISPPNNAVESEGILSVHAIYLGSVKVRPRDIVSALSRLALDSNGSSTAAASSSSSFSWNTSAHAGRRSRAALLSSASTVRSGRGGNSAPNQNNTSISASTSAKDASSSSSVTTPLRAQELPVVALCADALALELVGHALGNIRAEFDALRTTSSSSSSSSRANSRSRSRRTSSNSSSHRQRQDEAEEEKEEEEEENLDECEQDMDQRHPNNDDDNNEDGKRPHVEASSKRSHLRRVSHLKKLSRAIDRRTFALEAQLRPHGVTASDYCRGRAELLNRWALAALPPLPSSTNLAALPPLPSSSSSVNPTPSSYLLDNDKLRLDEEFVVVDSRERHEVLASAGVFECRLHVVVRAENYLAVVRHEAAGAAAPHLRR